MKQLKYGIALSIVAAVLVIGCPAPSGPILDDIITSGEDHTVAIRDNGTLWAWGNNFNGELGDGTSTDKAEPQQIGNSTNWRLVDAGEDFTVAMMADGSIWGWGDNSQGQLGDGTTTDKHTPRQIGDDTDWMTVDASGNAHGKFVLALKNNGTLYAWGNNNEGQLGDGTTTDKHVPTQIGTDENWAKVAAGEDWSLAIKEDGTLWAWGDNGDGQLGNDNQPTDEHSPIQVGTADDWAEIETGRDTAIALKTNGELWAWGANGDGQVGDGANTDVPQPKQISTDNWTMIAAGQDHSLALKEDGTIYAWGDNNNGQLGDGTTNDVNTPQQVGTNTDWIMIAGGDETTFGIREAGDGSKTYWAWGSNGDGELGDGTNTDRHTPVEISF
jgi:alpha-tubulin suppressor-like RCC1 family protein